MTFVFSRTRECIFVQFVYYFFKVLGVVPFTLHIKLNENKTIRKLVLQQSRTDIIYNLLLITVALVTNAMGFRVSYERYDFGRRSKFERTIDTVHQVFSTFFCIYILISFCVERRKIIKLGHDIGDFRESLKNIDEQIFSETKPISRSILKVIVLNFTTWMLVLLTARAEENADIIIYYVGLYFCSAIINHIILQYSILLKLLGQLFKMINRHFKSLSKKIFVSPDLQIIGCNDVASNDCATKIWQLHNLHITLNELSEEVSKIFARFMFLCVSYHFCTLIVYSYFFAKPIVLGKFTLPLVLYVHCFLQILHNATLIVILTGSVTNVVSQVKLCYTHVFQKIIFHSV